MACFVCGQTRSAESIREGKLRARQERIHRLSDAIYQRGYQVTRVAFFAGLLLSSAVVILMTILKITQGEVGSILGNLSQILEHGWTNIAFNIPANVRVVIWSLRDAPVRDLAVNGARVLSGWRQTMGELPTLLEEIFLQNAKNNVLSCYINYKGLAARAWNGHLPQFFEILGELTARAAQSVADILPIAGRIVQHVRELF